ncbi:MULTISPECIES: FAD-binding oxidoreductase [Rhodomicrobium]|uniref:FAD-binding oxidoreductase n=1 Tax=Rhodomicrobium TaxID=1068 RepID=UPI000B4BE918|nr:MULTISPECIES: FAD-binding oxidoreductase [Rhodomicrobium]
MHGKLPALRAGRIRALRDGIKAGGSTVFEPGGDSYAEACAIWNGAVTHEPALVVPCRTPADVQNAVTAAQAHGIPLSARGGGHDWAGRALRDGGLVLDLSAMRGVSVDAAARVATVAGGATARDLSMAAGAHGLAAVTGNSSGIGMAGYLLGGGYGALTPRFGLALDNLLGAEIVLADGRLVIADALQNTELFWALRGGGGNFGVVVSMKIRLHPVAELLAGVILFPWSQAPRVLRGYAEIMALAPDEFSAASGMISAPDGSPAIFIAPCWSGEAGRGQAHIERLQKLGTPLFTQIGPMSCTGLIGMFDDQVSNGRHYALRTRWLADLTPGVAAAIAAAGAARTSPFSVVAMHHFHGAGTRVAADATAFGLRRRHILVEIVAAWDRSAGDDGSRHREWASDLSAALARYALPGGYPNLLTPEDGEQLALSYGGNASRLRAVKRRYDPENVFASAIPIPD